MQQWLADTATGDRAELELEPSPALWAELAVGADRCSGRRCAFVGTCFAEGARTRAAEADLVIVNHALYFADVASGGGVLPEHDAVVFDEAHRLEESAAGWLGGRVSRAGLRRLALDVERDCASAQAAPTRRARARRPSRRAPAQPLAPPGGRRRVRSAGRGSARARRRARRLADALQGAAKSSTGLRGDRSARRAGRGVPRPENTSASSGPSPMRSSGRRSTSRRSSASGSGRTGRPRCSSRRR